MSTTMAGIISDVGSLISSSASWIGSAVSAVTSSPLLLFFVLVGFVSIGFGLLRRFF